MWQVKSENFPTAMTMGCACACSGSASEDSFWWGEFNGGCNCQCESGATNLVDTRFEGRLYIEM